MSIPLPSSNVFEITGGILMGIPLVWMIGFLIERVCSGEQFLVAVGEYSAFLLRQNSGFFLFLFLPTGGAILTYGSFIKGFMEGYLGLIFWSLFISIFTFLFCFKSIQDCITAGEEKKKKVIATNYYQHYTGILTLPVTICFVIQILLVVIYIVAIYQNNEKESLDHSWKTFFILFIGMMVSMFYLYSKVMKESWNALLKFYVSIFLGREQERGQNFQFYNNEGMKKAGEDRGYYEENVIDLRMHVEITPLELWTRLVMDLFVNMVLEFVVILLIPIHVAQSDSFESVVLNIVAAYFITEFDDLKNDKDMYFTKEGKGDCCSCCRKNSCEKEEEGDGN